MTQPTQDDRLLSSVRAMILAEFPGLTALGLWEYEVADVTDDGLISALPTSVDTPLPSLTNVSVRAMASGGVSNAAVGAKFLVEFRDYDNGSYAAISVEATVTKATLDASETVAIGPTASNPVELGPSPSKSVSRNGDGITVFMPMGFLNGVLVIAPGPPPVTIPLVNVPINIVTPAPGIVTGGTDKVRL